ncbi:hypothetical protein LA080_013755 [Diaporthe eres]|nr:hypothetical protein LA080_013755 [Diaporthe eres]
MSGLEVAGLVLGAFPIAIEVLGRYKEVARRLGFWYKIATDHKKCDSQLKFHQLVYVSNLKKLLLPLAGLDDARIDELLDNPGGKSWTEARTAENLEKRLGDSHEIYLQCIYEFQDGLKAMNHELAFDVASKQPLRESTPAKPSQPKSKTETLKHQGKWQLYRIRFSQAEKDREEIFARLENCNKRLKTLLQISEDNVDLAQKREAARNSESNALCRFWRQATLDEAAAGTPDKHTD